MRGFDRATAPKSFSRNDPSSRLAREIARFTLRCLCHARVRSCDRSEFNVTNNLGRLVREIARFTKRSARGGDCFLDAWEMARIESRQFVSVLECSRGDKRVAELDVVRPRVLSQLISSHISR